MNPADYRKELTARIIEQLEAGTAPWVKPWDPALAPMGSPMNIVSTRAYQGGNHLWLNCQGFADPRWCTYKQAHEKGWQVRKGERSTHVEYWQWHKDEKDEQGKIIQRKLDQPRVFYATVFNAQQIDGVPSLERPESPWSPEEAAENILQASGAAIYYDKSDTAFYSPTHDQIHMPPRMMFGDAAAFYGVALHELGHWSGHESRLARDLAHKFGTEGYAKEELRAELASYFLSAKLGIPHDPSQHAAYIGNWIEVLRKDHNELFRAAKDAEQITEFVLQFQKEKTLVQENTQATGRSADTATPSAKKRSREVELEC